MRAKRTDQNQKEIVKVLRDLGATVFDTSGVGKGYPDLNVFFKGNTILVEIKKDATAKLTVHQVEFWRNWQGGQLVRINNVDEAIALLKNML